MSLYEEGQVWEYRTRRGEERSLVKIQRIDADPDINEPIFHVSLVGLTWSNAAALVGEDEGSFLSLGQMIKKDGRYLLQS